MSSDSHSQLGHDSSADESSDSQSDSSGGEEDDIQILDVDYEGPGVTFSTS